MSCTLVLDPVLDAPVEPEVVVINPAMQAAHALIGRAASNDLPVLLLGETGVGKEILARELHQRGRRRTGPFKVVNCGAIPPGLLESTLFGHERGAFTDARCTSRGVFEQASGGTLFLDEVGELSAAAQAALLRVLETKRVARVGGASELLVDTRVVAATNRDLTEAAARGSFRLDLLYRLNALTVQIPPLRERVDEIGPMIDALLPSVARRCASAVAYVSSEARARLAGYRWPGNVRQLRNVLERAAIECDGDTIEPWHLPHELQRLACPASERVRVAPRGEPAVEVPAAEAHERAAQPPACACAGALRAESNANLRDRLNEYERLLILETLRRTHGHRRRAAALLGLPVRTLGHKIRRHGIGRRASWDQAHSLE